MVRTRTFRFVMAGYEHKYVVHLSVAVPVELREVNLGVNEAAGLGHRFVRPFVQILTVVFSIVCIAL